jgi:ELWxxDGT repeat protein
MNAFAPALVAASAAIVLLLLSSPVAAHHGTNINYDRSKQWTATVVVTEFKYVNPHAQLFFDATDPYTGTEPWRSDGTEAGTVRIKDINALSAGSNPSQVVNVNGVKRSSA